MFTIDIDFNGLETNTQKFIQFSQKMTKQVLQDIVYKLDNNKVLDKNELVICHLIQLHCYNLDNIKEKLQVQAFANKIGLGLDYSLIARVVKQAHYQLANKS